MADVVYGVKHGTSSTAGQGTLTQRLAYAYDGFGRLTTRTLSAINKTTSYTYVTNGTNGRTTVAASMQNGSETLSYVYDNNGNITEYSKGGSLQEKYYYDALNQLYRVNSVVQDKTIVYAYDDNGNILSKTEYTYTTGTPSNQLALIEYGYNTTIGWKDRLTAYDGQDIFYDGLGNPLTYRNGMSFTWQHGRELASVTLGGATTAYTYDETGSRVQKVSGGITTTYHVVDGTLMEEVRSDGKTLTYLLDENGTKYGVIYNGAYYYYIFNLQGDVIGLYNSSGTIVARYVYDAWGKLLAVTDNSGNAITDMSNIANLNPIRYHGYYYDVETGFYYLQSRYYDPTVGRFLNADALVSTGQGLLAHNMYAYCGNNPVNRVDPYGYACVCECGAVCGAGIAWDVDKVIKNNDIIFVLYDNDRFRNINPFHEQLIAISGPGFSGAITEGNYGVSIGADLLTGGWEWDNFDLSLLDFGHAEASVGLVKGNISIGALASAYSPSVSFTLFGLKIEFSLEAGAIGGGIKFGLGGFSVKGASGIGGGISVSWAD